MKAVRIHLGEVVEVFDLDRQRLTDERFFHPDFISELVDAPDTVAVGWRLDPATGIFAPQVPQ